MLSVFCVFRVWFGDPCLLFVVLLFLGPLLETFSGASFCFWASWLVLCFFDGVLPRSLFIIWLFVSENVSENSLHVRSVVFWGLFFFSSVFRRRHLFCFFSREKAQG